MKTLQNWLFVTLGASLNFAGFWLWPETLCDGKNIFDQYSPQRILETVEAGVKKSIFLQIGQFWMKNYATSNL